jgi:hypothetical protein
VGIGIRKINAGIGIPASVISVRYRIKKMLDCIILFRYRISSGIVSLSQSSTGLTGHSGIPVVSIAVVSIAVVSFAVVSIAVISMVVVSIAVPVVSIAVVSIAVVSIAVISKVVVNIAVVRIAVVSIAAVSIAEPHHVMRLQCTNLQLSCGSKSACHAAPVRHSGSLHCSSQHCSSQHCGIQHCGAASCHAVPLLERVETKTFVFAFPWKVFISFENTDLFAKTFAKTKIFTKTKFF